MDIAVLAEAVSNAVGPLRGAARDDAEVARIRQEMPGGGTQQVTGGDRTRMVNVFQVMK